MMDKRERIIQSAIKLFQEKGIDKTTISDIVRNANIAQGTFYIYFPSKLSLMPAIAEEMVHVLMERIKEKMETKNTVEQQLQHIIHVIFEVNKQYSEVQAVVYAGLASSEHIKEWEIVYEPCYQMISQLLEDAQKKGEVTSTISPKRMAKLLIGLVESAAEQVYLYDHSNEEEAVKQKEAVQQFLLDALRIDK